MNCILKSLALIFSLIVLFSCQQTKEKESSDSYVFQMDSTQQAGIYLPEGFSATLFAEGVGRGRNLTVADNGDVYAILRKPDENGNCIIILRDIDKDGTADTISGYPGACGTGSIEIKENYLYFSSDSAVYRVELPAEGDLVPAGVPATIAEGFIYHSQHGNKGFALDGAGGLYVSVGAPANACQEEMRTPGSPGMDPCPLLERYGGVWKFDDGTPNQKQMEDGYHYASGIRNGFAISYNKEATQLYVVQHGRDQLHSFFPEHYTAKESAELPAEEFFMVDDGDHFGWPYCYYDPFKEKKVLAPEYGGDGDSVGRCDQFEDPIMAFPAHYAPNDLIFYTGDQFPSYYKNGAFIAFHGSWNRGPLEEEGYQIAFVPFDGKLPADEYKVFADGFKGGAIESSSEAEYRPCGVAEAPDGSLYVIDSNKGRIWKISYTG